MAQRVFGLNYPADEIPDATSTSWALLGMRGLTGSIRNPKNNGQLSPFRLLRRTNPGLGWTWGQGYLHLTELQLEPDVAGPGNMG